MSDARYPIPSHNPAGLTTGSRIFGASATVRLPFDVVTAGSTLSVIAGVKQPPVEQFAASAIKKVIAPVVVIPAVPPIIAYSAGSTSYTVAAIEQPVEPFPQQSVSAVVAAASPTPAVIPNIVSAEATYAVVRPVRQPAVAVQSAPQVKKGTIFVSTAPALVAYSAGSTNTVVAPIAQPTDPFPQQSSSTIVSAATPVAAVGTPAFRVGLTLQGGAGSSTTRQVPQPDVADPTPASIVAGALTPVAPVGTPFGPPLIVQAGGASTPLVTRQVTQPEDLNLVTQEPQVIFAVASAPPTFTVIVPGSTNQNTSTQGVVQDVAAVGGGQIQKIPTAVVSTAAFRVGLLVQGGTGTATTKQVPQPTLVDTLPVSITFGALTPVAPAVTPPGVMLQGGSNTGLVSRAVPEIPDLNLFEQESRAIFEIASAPPILSVIVAGSTNQNAGVQAAPQESGATGGGKIQPRATATPGVLFGVISAASTRQVSRGVEQPPTTTLPSRVLSVAIVPVGFNDSGTGQLVLGGTGSDSATQAGSGSGTLTLGGSGTQSASHDGSGTGTLTLGGSGTQSNTHTASGTGTLVIGGSGFDLYIPAGGTGLPPQRPLTRLGQ